ncbi:MAG: hypothetical protein JO323_18615 [Acidobacteriia bacterium]|nr:hypothetical protein [Terriglobia bacterium]
MGSKDKSAKQRLREILAAERPEAITEAVWRDLAARLAPVSESYLRDLLRETGLPFEQPFAGVLQHSLEELERSLEELGRVYVEAKSAGDRDRARYCRRQVIAAKDRARFLIPKKPEKEEMVVWMLVWLDDPEMFPAWADARKRANRGSAEAVSK